MTLLRTPTGFRARVSVPGPNGRPTRVYFRATTEAEAQAKAQRFLDDIEPDSIDATMTVLQCSQRAIKRAQALGARPSTIRLYMGFVKCHVGPAIGRRRIVELRPSHVETMLERMQTSKQTKTLVRNFLTTAINRTALKDGTVSRNVAKLADVPNGRPTTKRPAITLEMLEKILAAEESPVRRAMYLLIATTGLRPSEARNLTWFETTQEKDGVWLSLHESKTEQGLEPVPVPAETWRAIEALGKRSRFVFPTSAGTPYCQSNLRRAWLRCLERAGLPETLHLHGLRKHFASVQARKSTRTVLKRLMRHTDARLTEKLYVQTSKEDLREAVES